jgi:hypothetical protein
VSTVNDYLGSTYIPLVPQQGLNFVASTPVKLYVDAGAGVRRASVVNSCRPDYLHDFRISCGDLEGRVSGLLLKYRPQPEAECHSAAG